MTRNVILAVGAAVVALAAAKTVTPPVFTDVTAEAGITFRHSFGDHEMSNIVEATGAGAVFFDYDGDGLQDIYFVNGAWSPAINDNRGRDLLGKLSNALYRNLGSGRFVDVTAKAGVGDTGVGFGASAADYDGDGDLDLYVLNDGPNVLYRNEGNGTFVDVSAASGLADPHWSLSAPWLDYDRDGDLDVYVANYLEYDAGRFRSFYAAAGHPGPLSYPGQQDALYRNNGDGTFTDVTAAAGLTNADGRAMSAVAADLDNDGLTDIYVANDAMENYFYRNTGKGRFEEIGEMTGAAFGEHGQGVSSMGPVPGDVDGDGSLDLYIPDMGYSTLLLRRGGLFEDRTAISKLAAVCGQYTGWGAVLFDYDNDTDLDLFVANGNANHEYTEEDVLVANDGTGIFTDVAARSGPYFSVKRVGRGASYADFDNDGDVDLLVLNLNAPAVLLRNDGGNALNWLTIQAKLANGRTDALGARLTVVAGGRRQVRELLGVSGYLSQGELRAHFGLGGASTIDRVEIRWPDGRTQRFDDVAANRIVTFVQDARREGGKP